MKWIDVVRALEYHRDTKLCRASCEDRNCYVCDMAYDMAISLIKENKLNGKTEVLQQQKDSPVKRNV